MRLGDKDSSASPPSGLVSVVDSASSFSSFSLEGCAGKVETRNWPNLKRDKNVVILNKTHIPVLYLKNIGPRS